MRDAFASKGNLVGAAIRLMLRQGYAGTSVDRICAEAGVTKGGFFHHFASKEAVCVAAMSAWCGSWDEILEAAQFDRIDDPLARVGHLFKVMEATYLGQPGDIGCLVGTIAQEQSCANPAMGERCDAHFQDWIRVVTQLLAEAKSARSPKVDFDPESVAWFLIGTVQGAMLVAKTQPDRHVISNNLGHARAYVEALFGQPLGEGKA